MKEIETQIKLLIQVVRCIHLKRELFKKSPKPNLNFWRLIQGGLLDLSVLEWTKIFGVNGEPTHWKGIVKDDNEKFKKDLFSYIGLSEQEWGEYWNEMTMFRNESIAHYVDDTEITHYPRLDIALASSNYYYSYLISRIRKSGENKYPDSLEEYGQRFSTQSGHIAELALNATKDIKEEVW
ncbi:MAG: hypothetical protein L3J89_09155 [Gammaproteobacteria bacterium]|nr:hypothetical protein [Gammaproteobacteria bacterium]